MSCRSCCADAMPSPESHTLWPRLLDSIDDHSIRLIPRARLEALLASLAHTAQWMQQAFGILKNLLGGPASHAEKALAIWVVLISLERQESVLLDLNRHPA